ncbi:hypothetical protein GW796_08915 [archaeon]|nr:hypothetical protein [archaeon]NCQ51999.1 hypothetical protein [archaeon]
MDQGIVKKIYWTIISISLITIIISLIGTYNTNKFIDEQTIAINKSPLEAFRLIDYRENSDGVFIDVVKVDNGKKYENNFISISCPQGLKKNPGLIMKLSVVEYLKPKTNEKVYSLDRAYEYLCTNINMNVEDEKLLKRIKEARDRMIKDNESNLPKN